MTRNTLIHLIHVLNDLALIQLNMHASRTRAIYIIFLHKLCTRENLNEVNQVSDGNY